MIDTKTEELAALYVMDLLKGDELLEFERQLSGDPEVASLVRELSTGLHAPMKQYNGPERMDLLEGIQERIGSAPAAATRKTSDQNPPSGFGIVQLRWIQSLSAAAALLLVLNIFQYYGGESGLVVELQEELAATRKAQQELLDENTTIKAFNKSWESEYMNLAQRMLPFIESRDGLGQFTVIDLLAVKGDKDFSKDGDISEYFLSRSPLKFTSVKMPDIPETSGTVTIGYTVWKQDEGRGYIDLYNLAEAEPGRAPFLWLRENKTEPYFPIGYLPFLDQGTGTFYFSVDEENFNPTEVLITEESVDGPDRQPSSHRMMQGP